VAASRWFDAAVGSDRSAILSADAESNARSALRSIRIAVLRAIRERVFDGGGCCHRGAVTAGRHADGPVAAVGHARLRASVHRLILCGYGRGFRSPACADAP